MALQVYAPGDFRLDCGTFERLYPVPEAPIPQDIVYDNTPQKTSYIQANVVGCFTDWITSFFPSDYFKFIRIRTQSSYAEFKSFMKQIYKKDKPFMLIDPRSIEIDESSIFAQNMLNRYNIIDPKGDNIGAKLLYSLEIMKSDMFEMVYRRNRYRFEFDIMIMEQTMDRQINTYNMIAMNIRHQSKFLLERTIPQLIPIQYVKNIANMHGYDWRSESFLEFMNSISQYPIIRRITPNGQYMFFFQQTINLQVEVPNMPQKDSPEMSEAIEWGARVADSFTIIADLPSEYLFMIPKEYMTKYDRHVKEDPDTVYCISPIFADMDWPTEIDGYTMSNKVDIMYQAGDDVSMDVIPVLEHDNPEIYKTIQECIAHAGKLSDLMKIRVYPNGSMIEAPYSFDDHGVLTLHNPKPDKLYTICIYLNLRTLNLINEGRSKEFIGTIQKY